MINRELLAAVLDDIDADAPRLVYADWLEESGDAPRAEFIRLQCEIETVVPGGIRCTACANCLRAGKLEERCKEILGQNLTGDKARFTNEAQWISQLYPGGVKTTSGPPIPFRWWTWRRGFIESAAIGVGSFPLLMQIAELTPITQIALYDYDPLYHDVFGWPDRWVSPAGRRVQRVLIPNGTKRQIGAELPNHLAVEELTAVVLAGSVARFMGAHESLAVDQRVIGSDPGCQVVRAAADLEYAIGRVVRAEPESGTVDIRIFSGRHPEEDWR